MCAGFFLVIVMKSESYEAKREIGSKGKLGQKGNWVKRQRGTKEQIHFPLKISIPTKSRKLESEQMDKVECV